MYLKNAEFDLLASAGNSRQLRMCRKNCQARRKVVQPYSGLEGIFLLSGSKLYLIVHILFSWNYIVDIN